MREGGDFCAWKPLTNSIQLVRNCNKIYYFIRKNNNNLAKEEIAREWGGNEKVFFIQVWVNVAMSTAFVSTFSLFCATKMCKWQGTMEPTISMISNLILGFSHIEMLELITFLIVSWKVLMFLMISHGFYVSSGNFHHTNTHTKAISAKIWCSTFMTSTETHLFPIEFEFIN